MAAHDPVGSGLVESLARPGGNVTGVHNQAADLAMKRMQITRELLPQAKTVAYIYARAEEDWHFPPTRQGQPWYGERFGFKLMHRVPVDGWPEIEAALATMREQRPDVLIVNSGALLVHNERLLGLATAHGIPTDCPFTPQVQLGCLIAYSIDYGQVVRQGGRMLAKILNGAKPAEIPVEQGTDFGLVINLKTANALGITIPPSLLARANRVIE